MSGSLRVTFANKLLLAVADAPDLGNLAAVCAAALLALGVLLARFDDLLPLVFPTDQAFSNPGDVLDRIEALIAVQTGQFGELAVHLNVSVFALGQPAIDQLNRCPGFLLLDREFGHIAVVGSDFHGVSHRFRKESRMDCRRSGRAGTSHNEAEPFPFPALSMRM